MNKFLIGAVALTIIFSSNKAIAQKGFSLSLKAIPQFSFLQNKNDNNNSSIEKKATFNAGFGIGAEYGFNKQIGLGIDVLYSLQGQRYKFNNVEYNQKVKYLKVPVYFTYTTALSKQVSFVGKLGPQVSFRTDSKFTDKDGNTITDDTNNKYKSVTFGGAALVGTQFKLNNSLSLLTAIRFDYDFTNAEDDSYIGYPSGRSETYNMTTGVEIGLRYNFK